MNLNCLQLMLQTGKKFENSNNSNNQEEERRSTTVHLYWHKERLHPEQSGRGVVERKISHSTGPKLALASEITT
jgi:hypothetical protein